MWKTPSEPTVSAATASQERSAWVCLSFFSCGCDKILRQGPLIQWKPWHLLPLLDNLSSIPENHMVEGNPQTALWIQLY